MSDPAPPEREQLLAVAARRLRDGSSPRLYMTGILFVAGLAAFVASAALLRLGVERMPVRYPLAVAAGYATFVGLLWAWLRAARGETGRDALDDAADAAYLLDAVNTSERTQAGTAGWGWGGLFSGGSSGTSSSDNDVVGTIIVAVLVTVAVCGVLFAAVYAVVIAPSLMAELLVDAAVVGALPKKDARHWTATAFRRTGWLAAGLAVLLGLVGYGLEAVVPGAHTLGQAMGLGRAR